MIKKNHKLMLLSNFALKAKALQGAINISEMIDNKPYAFKVLVQAALTNDSELIVQAEIVSYELNIGHGLIKAIGTYIKEINKFNNGDEFLVQSKYVLSILIPKLYDVNIDGASYRKAVELTLSEVGNDRRTFTINLSRKFYSLCEGHSQGKSNDKSSIRSNHYRQKNSFMKLWADLDNEFLYDKEISTLRQYVDFLRSNGCLEKDITISEKIAKVITIEIRNLQINPTKSYRDAVNNIQALFDNDELKGLTMIVSREYHNFWTGNIPKLWSHMSLN